MDKLRAILIDDEMLIRKLIRMKMDTEGLALEIVGEFSNSAGALEVVKDIKPDIVVSDICMPEEDGISFAEKCIGLFPDLKVIIVTGYDDFEYARRSLKAGIFDYLMKPVQAEELNAALKKAADEIRETRAKREQQTIIMEKIKMNLPALRNIYIGQILLKDTAEENMMQKLRDYEVDMEVAGKYGLQTGLLIVKESIERQKLPEEIREEAEAFFKADAQIFTLADSWGRVVVINNGADIPFEECMDLLVQLIEKKSGCHLEYGISRKYQSWMEIRDSYLNAINNLQKKHEKVRTDVKDDNWKALILAIKKGQVGDAELYCKQIVSDLQKVQERELDIKSLYCFVQKIGIDAEVNEKKMKWAGYIRYCRVIEDVKRWTFNMVMEMAGEKAIEIEPERGNRMKQILKYMEEEIGNTENGMEVLSKRFSISTSQMGRMFKRFTGRTYGELLSEFRLQKMLELLCTTELKDRDIGEQIGICDAHYLSIWFRKMTGYSVTEYRKLEGLWQKNETSDQNRTGK